MAKKLTQEEFIERAKAVHGGRYDYSKVRYVTNGDKVTIICKEHGEFPQTPRDHTSGKGCTHCGRLVTILSRKKSFTNFVAEANIYHDNKYSYVEDTYTTCKEEMTIICPVHGKFLQSPDLHLNGGCSKCGGSHPLGLEDFIKRSKDLFAETYDYSKTLYTNYHTNLNLVCRKHGVFRKTPAKHLSGQGCPKCSTRGFNPDKIAVLYIYTSKDFIGFGISTDFKRRSSDHAKNFSVLENPVVLHKVYTLAGDIAKRIERMIKTNFKDKLIDAKVIGFRTEALLPDQLNPLLDFIYNQIQIETPSDSEGVSGG